MKMKACVNFVIRALRFPNKSQYWWGEICRSAANSTVLNCVHSEVS